MADVIRTARIVIHLEQGKAALDAQALAPILEQKKQEVALTEQSQQANAAAAEAASQAAVEQQQAVAPLLDQKQREAELAEEARRAHAEAGQAAAEAAVKQAKANADVLGGIQAVGEGVFTLGRSMTLFAASGDESLARLARSVATVQAGMDLFKGTIQTIRGVAEVVEKTAAAATAAAAAEQVRGAATAATVAPTAAAAAATSGLAAAVAALALPITIVVGAIAAALTAWKLWSDSTEEAAAEAEDTRQRMADLDATLAGLHTAAAQRDLQRRDTLRERMTAEEQLLELQRRQADAEQAAGRSATIERDGLFGGGQKEAQQEQLAAVQAGLDAMREEANLRRELTSEREKQLADQEKLIEGRQRELELARQTLDTEQRKVDAFAAQFGQLTQAQQARLQGIADKVRGGDELSRGELGFLSRFGGEQGRAIATDEFRQRGEAAGAGNVFAGIAIGAPGVAAAQQEVDAARGRLNEATGGKPPEQALDDLRAEATDVRAAYEEFLAGQREAWERAVAVMQEIDGRIAKLEQAAAQQKAFQ